MAPNRHLTEGPMNDRNYLRNLAAKLESTPSLTMDGGASAKRLRAIADAIGEDQDTSAQDFTHDVEWTVRTVVTNGLPPGAFIYTASPAIVGAPPTIVGSCIGGRECGMVARAEWLHLSYEDSPKLRHMLKEIQDGNIDRSDLATQLQAMD